MPAILNAANEVAVEAFLQGKIRFPEITLSVAETMTRVPNSDTIDIAAVMEADLAARVQAESIIEALVMNKQQKQGKPLPCPDLPPAHKPLKMDN